MEDSSLSIATLPLDVTISPSNVTGGNSVQCTIRVDAVPVGGSSIQVSTDHPSLLGSPSGSWPYNLAYSSPSVLSQTFTITTQPQAASNIKVYACEAGVDITDPNNWRVVGTMNIL